MGQSGSSEASPSSLIVPPVESKWILYNTSAVLMIIKYKWTIGYANKCSSVQDHKIQFIL